VTFREHPPERVKTAAIAGGAGPTYSKSWTSNAATAAG